MRPPPDNWQLRIRRAQSEQEVMGVVREFIASLDADDVALLPASSRPSGIASGDDIAALTVQVARDELMFKGDAKVGALLRQMLVVLTEATNRLSQLSLEARLLRPGS